MFGGHAVKTRYVLSTVNTEANLTIALDNLGALEETIRATIEQSICIAQTNAKKEYEAAVTAAKEGCETSCSTQCKSNCNCSSTCANAGNNITEPDYANIAKDIEEEIRDGYKDILQAAKDDIKKWQDCLGEATSYSFPPEVDNSPTSTILQEMKIPSLNYTQQINSIIAIEKNSGDLLNSKIANSITNLKNFVVPKYVSNGTSGETHSKGTASKYHEVEPLEATCSFDIANEIICQPGDVCPSGKYNLIFRPISLTNPFPNAIKENGLMRETMGYWDELTADEFIINNRKVSDYNVYNLEPMYSITLTPSTISEIRKYNKKNSYNDFNLDCDNGLYCKSNFLRNSEFTDIVNKGKSCGIDNDWYACDDEQLGKDKDSLFNILRR